MNTIKQSKIIFLIKKVRRVQKWTSMEDKLLMIISRNYGFKNWNSIASQFQGRTAIQCCARYKRIRPGGVKGLWTIREDKKVLKFVKEYGRDWGLISKLMVSRTGKQIRDRYLNSLDPGLNKKKFSKDEDEIIMKYYLKFGSKWTKIASFLDGRSGDMVKNRFYTFLKKSAEETKKLKIFNSCETTEDINMPCLNSSNL
jgi:myb proto-oncogene protein